MDADHFDALSRFVAAGHSRRTLTRVLAGVALGGLLTLGTPPTQAKKRKKRRRRAPPPAPPPPGLSCGVDQKPCNGVCIRADRCCTNSDCAAGQTCQRGACTCDTDDDCQAQAFCHLDTKLCTPCRGTAESCDVGGGTTNSRACCSNHCVGSVATCRAFCGAHEACPSGKCCFQVLSPSTNYCALTPTEECSPG